MLSEREQLEQDIKKLEKDIEFGVSLAKLKENKDFIDIISNGFLQEYVLDILYLGNEIDYVKLESAKTLNDYFTMIETKAETARNNQVEYVKELNNY